MPVQPDEVDHAPWTSFLAMTVSVSVSFSERYAFM
jgi:hypothetical protein